MVSAFRTPWTVVRASISGAQRTKAPDTEKLVPTAVGYLFDRLISKYKSWPLRLCYTSSRPLPRLCTSLEEGGGGWRLYRTRSCGKKAARKRDRILINAGNKSGKRWRNDSVKFDLQPPFRTTVNLRVVIRIYGFPSPLFPFLFPRLIHLQSYFIRKISPGITRCRISDDE